MKNLILILGICSFTFGSSSCKKDIQKENAKKIVAEWIGNSIEYPSGIPVYSTIGDTIIESNSTPYTVVLFTDSTGCTSCKLQLYKWNSLIEETKESMPDKLSFKFYFHPQNEKELKFLLKRDNFAHPVFIDIENKMDAANQFPNDANFQCFLLGKDDKVILIGNPTINPAIWDLYKQAINEEAPTTVGEIKAVTIVEVKETTIELDDLQVGKTSSATFVLKNVGDKPLFIADISTSCGCTVSKWDKKPIKPNEETEIKVEVTPDSEEYFNETVSVFCNADNGVLILSIEGETKQ